MQIANATVLITGANRGLGLAFARAALARGARKVYAAARDPSSITLPGVVPIRLDVTRPEEVAAAARDYPDVTLLINNAGIAATGGFLAADSLESALRHMDTNVYGPLRLTQAFAPHVGFVDTDLTRGLDVPKSAPAVYLQAAGI